MYLSQRVLVAAVGMTAILLSANAGVARGLDAGAMAIPLAVSYSGSYPVTISHAKVGNGTYCLTLNETGRNSGSASFVEGHTLVATVEASGYGQNAGLVFIGSAHRGNIGPGVFDEVYGGGAFVEGALAWGMKGGC